jgi:hypothetical protein
MKLPRREFLHLAAGAAALPAFSRIAWTLDYPSRPVRIIELLRRQAQASASRDLWKRAGSSIVVRKVRAAIAPTFFGIDRLRSGMGAEWRQLLLRHWLETPTASFGGYHEERSVASR